MSQLSFNDLLRRLREADDRLIAELERTLHISALRLERDGKLNATTFPRVRTGRLRSSITGFVDSTLGTPRVFLKAGSSGSGVDYAEFVEFGTRYIQPRLFLGRAINAEQQRLPDRLSSLLNVALGAN
jgi:hypothetical protein